MERESKKSEKEEKNEKLKLKKAIQKGNMEGARIHAENSIRQKNQSLNYLRMAARVDAVASRVQSAVTQRKVSKLNNMLSVYNCKRRHLNNFFFCFLLESDFCIIIF